MVALVIEVSIRSAAAALAVAAILWLLRIRSATLRHAAWSAVLVVMFTMPVLTSIVPTVPLPVPSRLAVDLGAIAGDLPSAGGDSAPNTEGASQAVPARSSAAAVPGRSPGDPADRVAAAPDWRTLTQSLAIIYALGAMLLGAHTVIGWRMARRVRRSGTAVDLRCQFGVLESAAVHSPLTIGILRPAIVLPIGWRDWPAEKLRAVLAHEVAHAGRRDGLITFLALVNRAVFWFHPLAWWLPRTLTREAEHACDDAAREVIGAREYAQLLVEIAARVASRNSRIAWQTPGVEGSGLLGERINRLLRGGDTTRPSRLIVAIAALACAFVLAGAVACRRPPAPLQPDPELARQYDEQAKNTAEFRAAINMTLEEVDALEQRIEANPNDWVARRRLVTYYTAGTKVPWERKVPGLRRHALWLIEHHPEHDVAAPPLSPEYDPEGFAQAVRLWDRHLATPDVTPYLVYRAAQFFSAHDRPRAEQLILRGRAIDPDSKALGARMPPQVGGYQWHTQLGTLYARTLLGSEGYYPSRQYNPEAAVSPFAQEVKRKLAATRDARLLARVGGDIIMARTEGEPVADMRRLGREYLERAVQIDPQLDVARTMLARADSGERHERIHRAVIGGGEVPDEDRLAYVASKANWAYVQSEGFESWRKDPDRARKARSDAKSSAEATLELAALRRNSPDYSAAVMGAHQTLGLIALRDGDRAAAVRHLLNSVDIPPMDANDSVFVSSFVAQRLPAYLLKEGERETVIQYYEMAAKINPRDRERLLEDAHAVREGRMPRNYQAVFGRTQ